MDRLLAFPPVQKLLEVAKPQLDAAYGTYTRLHASVVASPRYKQGYNLAAQVRAGVRACVRAWPAQRAVPGAQCHGCVCCGPVGAPCCGCAAALVVPPLA